MRLAERYQALKLVKHLEEIKEEENARMAATQGGILNSLTSENTYNQNNETVTQILIITIIILTVVIIQTVVYVVAKLLKFHSKRKLEKQQMNTMMAVLAERV